jgi:hypothetical protein
MGKTYSIGLAGESFRNKDGTSRQSEIKKCHAGERVTLVRDRDNKYDSNAILCVSSRGIGLGMVKGDHTTWLAPKVDSGSITAKIDYIHLMGDTLNVVLECAINGGGAKAPTIAPIPSARRSTTRKGFWAKLFGL